MRILLVGGGSIGHVAPAVAVWRALEKKGAVMRYICSEEPVDAAFLSAEHIPFDALHGRRFSPVRVDIFLSSWLQAKKIIRDFHPNVVFSKGGALSVPVCLAAKSAGIPIVLHESDAVSGRANRLVSRWAKAVCKGFSNDVNSEERRTNSGKGSFFTLHSSLFTGNPVRPDVTAGQRKKGLEITGFHGKRPILLVMGGSQGAEALNKTVARHLTELLQVVDVIHLTGKGKPGAEAQPGYWSTEFAHEELPHLYAITDFALSRSGAGGISELAANRIPALLVPLRGLAQDHQLHNAEAAVRSGGCVLLHQETLDQTLPAAVHELANDPKKRKAMGEKIASLHVQDAAEKIAEAVMAAGKRHGT